MEFPEELWNLIFSYFHSAYRKPTHYVCIMDNHDFYYIHKHNKNSVNINLKLNKNFDENRI